MMTFKSIHKKMLEKIVNLWNKAQDVMNEISCKLVVGDFRYGDKIFHAGFLGALPFYIGTKINETWMKKKMNKYLAGF